MAVLCSVGTSATVVASTQSMYVLQTPLQVMSLWSVSELLLLCLQPAQPSSEATENWKPPRTEHYDVSYGPGIDWSVRSVDLVPVLWVFINRNCSSLATRLQPFERALGLRTVPMLLESQN